MYLRIILYSIWGKKQEENVIIFENNRVSAGMAYRLVSKTSGFTSMRVRLPPHPQRKKFLLLKNFNVVGTFKSKIYYVPLKFAPHHAALIRSTNFG